MGVTGGKVWQGHKEETGAGLGVNLKLCADDRTAAALRPQAGEVIY